MSLHHRIMQQAINSYLRNQCVYKGQQDITSSVSPDTQTRRLGGRKQHNNTHLVGVLHSMQGKLIQMEKLVVIY